MYIITINYLYLYIYIYPPSLFGLLIAGSPWNSQFYHQSRASVCGLLIHDGSRLVLRRCDGVL